MLFCFMLWDLLNSCYASKIYIVQLKFWSYLLATDEESTTDKAEQEKGQDNPTDESDKSDVQYEDCSKPDELSKSISSKRVDGKFRSLSTRVINCQGKNLRIHIPLTNPTRTFSAITYLLWDDLVNQSSKKYGVEGSRLHINKTKLHHAEKMIRGAFIELYRGLGYLQTYR